jgi:hypothetical protein
MIRQPRIRPTGGLTAPIVGCTGTDVEQRLGPDLITLREIVSGLDRLEERLDSSEIPKTVTARGYFTPDEDDRVRQGVLAYRNYRLGAYELILRYRSYASLLGPCRLRCFLVGFGAALVLYSKSLKIISFAEHVPMVRAKINEADSKYDLEPGFFEDVMAGYSRICNYRSIRQADRFWRAHRAEANTLAYEDGGDWVWLAGLICRQRKVVRHRLLHVLWQRFRYDWRAFCRTSRGPFRQARHGLESLLGDHLAEVEVTDRPTDGTLTPEMVSHLASLLQPGDVLLTRNDHRLTAALLPGFWAHAALFIGGRSELETLGLRAHPYVLRHWDQIPENSTSLGLVIEALAPRVQLNPLEKCLRVDHLVVIRPALPSSEIAAAIGEALGHLHKPYDFEFDFNNSSRVVCTELIYRAYHNRGSVAFSLTKRLGRFTLSGDDLVAYALGGTADAGLPKAVCFKPVALVLTRRDGKPHVTEPERICPLLYRLRHGWRPAKHLRSTKSNRRERT